MAFGRRREPGQIASATMWVAGAVTLCLLVAFLLTECLWYERLDLGQRVSFWAEAAVAYGTLALAMVTWGSVKESQDIVSGENLRFRQSRMPMVVLSRLVRERGGVLIELRNNGDGPARNVRLTFDAHTILRWNEQGLADQRDKSDETDIAQVDFSFASFMRVGDDGSYNWTFNAKPAEVFAMNAESYVMVKKLLIKYEDVFGSLYETEYQPNPFGGIEFPKFTWRPPTELLPG